MWMRSSRTLINLERFHYVGEGNENIVSIHLTIINYNKKREMKKNLTHLLASIEGTVQRGIIDRSYEFHSLVFYRRSIKSKFIFITTI